MNNEQLRFNSQPLDFELDMSKNKWRAKNTENLEELRKLFKERGYESISCWIPPHISLTQEQAVVELLETLKTLPENSINAENESL